MDLFHYQYIKQPEKEVFYALESLLKFNTYIVIVLAQDRNLFSANSESIEITYNFDLMTFTKLRDIFVLMQTLNIILICSIFSSYVMYTSYFQYDTDKESLISVIAKYMNTPCRLSTTRCLKR